MKVLVAHPGKQHSYKTAVALQNADMLYMYMTTTYQKKGSLTKFVTKFLPPKQRKKAESHYEPQLDERNICLIDEWMALFSLLLEKLNFSQTVLRRLNSYRIDHFGKKIARIAIKANVDAVIMWDTTTVECFKILKKKAPQIKRILDCSTANRLYLVKIYEDDMKKYHHNCFKKDIPYLWEPKNHRIYEQEIEYADVFIGPSEFVKRSYKFSGVDEKRIFSVPYGVDINQFSYLERKTIRHPIKLIFVGGVQERKGIHHLLKVMKKFTKKEVVLDLVGGIDINSTIFRQASQLDNVNICGFTTRDKLAQKYQEADVFVFPTLGEGYGLVILEALSCGVPVITSNHAGGNDAIKNGWNGIVYNAESEDELENAIRWFYEHIDNISQMRRNARKTAEQYTWDAYYKNYSKTIGELLEKGRPRRLS